MRHSYRRLLMISPLTWKDVPLKQKERLRQIYQNGQSLDAEANALGVTRDTLARYLRQYNQYRREFQVNAADQFEPPKSRSRKYIDFQVADGDDWLIISDLEMPDHSYEMLKVAFLKAVREGVKKCVIAGDV